MIQILQMRIGQTSAITFVSQLLAAILGFGATIYFSRVLGAEVLGIYALVMAIVGWINLTGSIGIGTATRKRISEGTEQGKYMSASLIISGSLLLLGIIILFIGRSYVESYVGSFGTYSNISVVWVIILIVIVNWSRGYTSTTSGG